MRLGTFLGIEFRIHPSFWLLVGLVAFAGFNRGLGVGGTLAELGFVLALFVSVMLHELGHALAARRYGIPTRSITLSMIGGLANLERMPNKPVHELVIALAGPAVNVVLASLSGLALLATDAPFVSRFAVANLVLVGFNLIPAFPMDGGRVLRALLATRLPYARATEIAAKLGRVLVVPFVVAGVLLNPVLLLIGAFVWFAAGAELRAARARDGLQGARVMHASMAKLLVLHPEDRLDQAVELTLDGTQKDFPVVAEDGIIGSLTQRRLLRAVKRQGLRARVADVMQASPPSVDVGGSLEDAVRLMEDSSSPFVVVTEDRQPVGVVTMENVEEFMRIRHALGGRMPIRIVGVTPGAEADFDPDVDPEVDSTSGVGSARALPN